MKAVVLALALCAAASGAIAQKAGQWSYRSKADEMSTKKVQYAEIASTNSLNLPFPYAGLNTGRILVRSKDGETNVMFSVQKGQILCSSYAGCKVTIRFDDDEPEEWEGSESSDHDSRYVFIEPEPAFILKAKSAKKIRIRVTMFQSGLQTLTFDPKQPLKWESD